MFEAEVVDMEIFMETLGEIKYNPMMLGVPISGPSYIYGYSMSVIHNTQRPEYTSKKKSNYIFYSAVCDSVRMGESLTGHIGTNKKCSDLATKHRFHLSNFLYDIYDDL